MAAVVALAAVVGCGGGGDGDDDVQRTKVSCADGQDACGTARSDTPTEMSCNEGYREVTSCSPDGARAVCNATELAWETELYVYSSDPEVLSRYQGECADRQGTWTPLAQP